MTISDHYKSIVDQGSNALADLLKHEGYADFTRAHNYICDFELLLGSIPDRPERHVLELAAREYNLALYSAATANYRAAMTSLRLFFELSLATVYFSAYEIKLRKWMNNSGDIAWATIIDSDSGVFSFSFIEAFNSNLCTYGKQYLAISQKAYRECSEFVHGNFHTHFDAGIALKFEPENLQNWLQKSDAVHLCVLFSFISRYAITLSPSQLDKIESLILDNFGHISEIRQIYGEK